MLPGRLVRPLAVAGIAGAVAVAAISVAAAGPGAGARTAVAGLLAVAAVAAALWVTVRRLATELDDRTRRLMAVAERAAGE